MRNFGEYGGRLTGVNGFLLFYVTAVKDGDYGLFPEFSSNGVIEYSTASGHRDTGSASANRATWSFAVQAPSDAWSFCAFYDRFFDRQGAFPILLRPLANC